MSNRPSDDNPVGRIVVTAGLIWLLYSYPPGAYAHPYHHWAWWAGAAIAAIGVLKSLPRSMGSLGNIVTAFRALFGRDDTKGSAGWLTVKEASRAGLHRRRKGSRFIGTLGRIPLWLRTETHHLIIGPAGSQKSTSAIMNILMGCSESALVSDVKGELFETTGPYRAKRFGHAVHKIDPKDPANSIRINPIDRVLEAIKGNDPAALTRARGIALQLLPDPEGGGGANAVFYTGGRQLISTAILAVSVAFPPEHCTLTTVYRVLSDMDLFEDVLRKASKSKALNGEIADTAGALHDAAFGEGPAAKTFESFRLNAQLALEAFGPGNYLTAVTSSTTVSFKLLKERKASIYILIDFANTEVLGTFSGLCQWQAADELVEVGNNTPVLFVLDEFCNAPLHSLPKIMTLLRSYGIKCILATQDLDDIVRVYSKHALETVLSETHIKQFLGAIRSHTTLEYITKALGEFTETSSSYAFSRDGVQESLSRSSRKLLNEDELRRLPDSAQIVFFGNLKPILAKKVQVFAITPWRRLIGTNALYGGKRKYLPVEMRVEWFGTTVTKLGRRAHHRIERELAGRSRRPFWRPLGMLLGAIAPGRGLMVALLLGLTIWTVGLPNLRWEYGYRGARPAPGAYVWCRYVGPTSPGVLRTDDCPLILFRKGW